MSKEGVVAIHIYYDQASFRRYVNTLRCSGTHRPRSAILILLFFSFLTLQKTKSCEPVLVYVYGKAVCFRIPAPRQAMLKSEKWQITQLTVKKALRNKLEYATDDKGS